MLILTSWDDGHPSDLRLAEVLRCFGLKGTLFIPLANSEGLPVVNPVQIRRLAEDFEIGGHTLDHVYLNTLDRKEMLRQVGDCRKRLEDITSAPVRGFCYPGGRLSEAAVAAVKDAGYGYARTVEQFRFDVGSDLFRLPTTIQFYPHLYRAYCANYLRYGAYRTRWPAFKSLATARSLQERLRNVAMECMHTNGVFHLWGHSWELDALGLWNELESFLAFLTSLPHEAGSLDVCSRRATFAK
jgi:peptidoglycan/xylan/chitin deacetylase (PgdA/CDA1 family)